MKIAIGSDRRGFEVKEKLKYYLVDKGYEVEDVGPYDGRYPVDYPIFGEKIGKAVVSGNCNFGVAICATGTGIMIAANKVNGIRCGMAYTDDAARLMREHNDANVIAFGASQMSYEMIEKRVDIFLNSSFLGGYHSSRIQQLTDIEQGKTITQTPYIDNEFK